jgi:4-aminobutyrate aminotransferase/(S)-3-amino-2-methylpropionate transaminase
LPLAAVTGRAEIMDSVHASGLGRHLRRQPARLRGSARAIATMREQDLAARARAIGDHMLPRLTELAEADIP